MAEKIFMERDRLTLRGDDRDFMLPVQYRRAVLRWCKQNGIDVEMPLNKDGKHIAQQYFGVNLWRVRDEKQRAWFALRWS